MVETLVDMLQEWGVWGVLLSLLIEGTAFPFIGTFYIVTVGFVLQLAWYDIAWISLLGSLLYAVGSYIPFYLGYKLEGTVERRLKPTRRESLNKAIAVFNKHGIWSVAIASPLHLGNVVPFVAGMAKMNLRTYTFMTILGIAPSTFLFLSLGSLYTGDKEKVLKTIVEYQTYVLIGFVVFTTAYIGWKLYRRKQKHRPPQS